MDYREKVKNHMAATTPRDFFIGARTLAEISYPPPPEHGDTWGDWQLSLTYPPSLDYVGGGYKYHPYQIELSRLFPCKDQDATLVEWIEHLHGKIWGNRSMGDFIDALLTIKRYGIGIDEVML